MTVKDNKTEMEIEMETNNDKLVADLVDALDNGKTTIEIARLLGMSVEQARVIVIAVSAYNELCVARSNLRLMQGLNNMIQSIENDAKATIKKVCDTLDYKIYLTMPCRTNL